VKSFEQAERSLAVTPYTYEYPRPAVTVDCLVGSFDGQRMHILLIQRDREPFQGSWALPGGFIGIDEPLEEAARRELAEETGLKMEELAQFRAYGDPGRDPRGRTVAVVFYGFCPWENRQVQGGDDARQADWFPWDEVPPLAFDHEVILSDFRGFLRREVKVVPFGQELLPKKFPRSLLVDLYAAVLGDRREGEEHAARLARLGVVVETSPPARGKVGNERWYRFDLRQYRIWQEEGFPLTASGRGARNTSTRRKRG